MISIRKVLLIVPVLILAFSAVSEGQVKFREIKTRQEMEEAMALSDSLKLPLFVDVYATWCSPCKMMDRDTYSDRTIGKLLNTGYIPLKMDGETDYGSMFSYQYQLEGYPSAFVFAPGGELMTRMVGYMTPEDLAVALRKASEAYNTYELLQPKFTGGNLNPEEYASYITALVDLRKDEQAESAALTYLSGIDPDTDLNADDIRVIANYVTPGTPVWKQILKQRDLVRTVLDTAYSDFISSAFYRSVLNAIQLNDRSGVDLFTSDLQLLTAGTEVDGRMMTDMAYLQFYYYTMDLDSLFSYIDKNYAQERKGDDSWLFTMASQLIDLDQQYANPEILEKALEWFNICLSLNEKFDYYFYSGTCHYMLGDMDKSVEFFKKARTLAGNDNEKELIENVFNAISGQ
ncbi:MAG: thioredoxin family protein [Bacteroidota bacterium]